MTHYIWLTSTCIKSTFCLIKFARWGPWLCHIWKLEWHSIHHYFVFKQNILDEKTEKMDENWNWRWFWKYVIPCGLSCKGFLILIFYHGMFRVANMCCTMYKVWSEWFTCIGKYRLLPYTWMKMMGSPLE